MGAMCGVCRHESRMDIDRDLLGLAGRKLTQREVAAKYGLGRGQVQRHVTSNHVSRVMSAVAQETTLLHGNGLLQEIGVLYETTQRIMAKAENAEDLKTAISAIREARGCMETFARIGLALAKGEDEPDTTDRSKLDDAIDDALKRRQARLSLPEASARPVDPDDEVAEAEVVEDEPV